MITDHKGNKYSSIRAMYRAYGLTDWLYYQRKKKGWHIIEILETPVRPMKTNNNNDTEAYRRKTHKEIVKSKPMKLLRKETTKLSGGYVVCHEYGCR